MAFDERQATPGINGSTTSNVGINPATGSVPSMMLPNGEMQFGTRQNASDSWMNNYNAGPSGVTVNGRNWSEGRFLPQTNTPAQGRQFFEQKPFLSNWGANDFIDNRPSAEMPNYGRSMGQAYAMGISERKPSTNFRTIIGGPKTSMSMFVDGPAKITTPNKPTNAGSALGQPSFI